MANIELPKDADGREIQLDTKVLYDKEGKRREVDWYTFYPDKDRWEVIFEDSCVRFSPHNLSLTPPDSWEKLLADLKRGASRVHHPECAYFARDENDCDQCEAVCSFACKKIAFGDIESRIRKLRGEGE